VGRSHEVAADLKLHSSTRAEEEGKYVICGTNMNALGLELHAQVCRPPPTPRLAPTVLHLLSER
jgi:hypothetical protein